MSESPAVTPATDETARPPAPLFHLYDAAWVEIKRAVGYGDPSKDWTDVQRAVRAAAPFFTAPLSAEVARLREAHESTRRGLLRMETQRDDLRTAVLAAAGIDPDTANEDTDYAAALIGLRGEVDRLRTERDEARAEASAGREIVLHVARLLGTSFQPDGLEAEVISKALTETIAERNALDASLDQVFERLADLLDDAGMPRPESLPDVLDAIRVLVDRATPPAAALRGEA